jgi:hypothetical protein
VIRTTHLNVERHRRVSANRFHDLLPVVDRLPAIAVITSPSRNPPAAAGVPDST